MNLHYSQTDRSVDRSSICLIPLWIYITLKLGVRVWCAICRLIPLWIYITLKPKLLCSLTSLGLIPLWIYITLKHQLRQQYMTSVLYLYEFTLLSNTILFPRFRRWSYTSMNLHYSQTILTHNLRLVSLIPLWIYITLKRYITKLTCGKCLIPLWIYITLKHSV